MSDRAQSGYCFFEESNGILLQLLMEKIFDVFGREWMRRGEEEREARLTPCPISFRSLGGWDRASVVPSRQCLYTGCVRSVDGTDIPGVSSSGPSEGWRNSSSVGEADHRGVFHHGLPSMLSVVFLVPLLIGSSEVPDAWTCTLNIN